MRAIILAAGRGARLEAAGMLEPKALLELGGATLLDRHLRNLDALGVEDVRVCVGYRRERVEAALASAPAGLRIEVVENPDYREGSVVTVWTARDALDGGDELLLMDADVLYAPTILERLVRSPSPTALLVDRDFMPGDEPVKVCLRDGAIVEFSKRVPPGLVFDDWGESVGFFKLAPERAVELAQRCDAYVRGGRGSAPHEEAIRDMVLEDPRAFAVEDATGLPWIEIDFPEDVTRARDVILPRVEDALREART